jgi:hypothetical protein
MKISIGGEIEKSLYDQFRITRNIVLNKLDDIKLDIVDINELSFYVYLLKNFDTLPHNKYLKRYKRIEIEIVLSFDVFKNAEEQQRIDIIENSISNSILNFVNNNIKQEYIDLIKGEIKKRLG